MTTHHRIASGQAALAVEAVGQGDPVVFLHANVCDSRMWQHQIAALGADHRVIAYDRRGFGGTQGGREAFSSVEDLMAVVDAMAGSAPPVLVGCSQGGKIAIDTALRHPARIRALVLIAPSIGGAPEAVHSPSIAALLARQTAAKAAGDLDAVNAIKARLWLDGPLAAEGRMAGEARRLFLDMNAIALRAPSPGPNRDTALAYGRLGEIAVPTQVLWGSSTSRTSRTAAATSWPSCRTPRDTLWRGRPICRAWTRRSESRLSCAASSTASTGPPATARHPRRQASVSRPGCGRRRR